MRERKSQGHRNTDLKAILEAFHDNSGHDGVLKTRQRVSRHFQNSFKGLQGCMGNTRDRVRNTGFEIQSGK